jgi:1,2-diacylglycerol 3-beta-glucosyltransferase
VAGVRLVRRAVWLAGRAGQAALWVALSHLALLSAAGALPPRPVRPAAGGAPLRVVVLVPAHDEEQGLPATLAALAAVRPPSGGLDVVVVADHCTDGTARVAAEAGALVWQRSGAAQRGKGAALQWALERLLAEPRRPDAVAVVDADTAVDDGFFPLAEQRLAAGAQVVQGRYLAAVPPVATLVSRLAEAAQACQSVLRPRGRARLGGAAKLQGNGMVFRTEVLEQVPWDAYGVAEDVGYWLSLLRAGVRPEFEPAAGVRGAMPTDLAAARVQRTRWEAGRVEVTGEHARPALAQAWRTRDPVLAEAVVSELVVPPLSMLAAAVVAIGALRSAAATDRDARRRALRATAGQGALLAGHVLTGLRTAGAGRDAYAALAAAPLVVLWKVGLKLGARRKPQAGWVRTPRDARPGTPAAPRPPSPPA